MNIRIVNESCDRSWNGKRVAIVCTKGCNLKCNYCFLGNLIGKAEVLPGEWEAVYRQLLAIKSKIDGVVVTGGEPTLHNDLFHWLSAIKDLNLKVKLETNGTQPEILRNLIQNHLIDSIMMDVKATPENYATVCGTPVDTEAIKQSIWIIKSSKIDHEFTTTLVPGYHTIRELRKIVGMIHGAKRFIVRDFVSKNALRPELRGRAAFPHKPIESVRHLIERKVEEFIVESNEKAVVMHIPGRRKRRRRSEVEIASI